MRIEDINLGGAALPLYLQLGIERVLVESEQADLDALNRLRARGLLPPSVAVENCQFVFRKLFTRLVDEGVLTFTQDAAEEDIAEQSDADAPVAAAPVAAGSTT